jgi:phosphatidylinositol alpha-1,6-mannosyltransferase
MARVLLVTNDYPPDRGGIQSYLEGLVAHSSHEFRVMAPAAEAAQTSKNVVRHASGGFLWPTRATGAWVTEEVERFRPDFILFGAPHPLAFLGPRMASVTGLPYGVVTHGAEVAVGRSVPGFGRMMKKSLRAASVVFSVSDFTGRLVAGYTASDVVRLGVGVSHHQAVQPRRPDVFTVLCVSRFVPRKGQARLIAAIGQLDDEGKATRLRLIGAGRRERRLRAKAAASGASVDVLVGLSTAEIADEYQQASVFAMPCRSRWFGREFEGLGIVYLEAAAAGLPVIVGDSGGAPETIVPGVTGFVASGRKNLVEAIAWVRDHPSEAIAMGEAGKKFVSQKFDWGRVSARFDVAVDEAVRP